MDPTEMQTDSVKKGQALDSNMDSHFSVQQTDGEENLMESEAKSEDFSKHVTKINQSKTVLQNIIRKEGLICEVSHPIEMIVKVSNLKASNTQTQTATYKSILDSGQNITEPQEIAVQTEELVLTQPALKENNFLVGNYEHTENISLLQEIKDKITNVSNLELSDLPVPEAEHEDTHESQFNQEYIIAVQEEETNIEASESQLHEDTIVQVTNVDYSHQEGSYKQEEIIFEIDNSISNSQSVQDFPDQLEPYTIIQYEQNVETKTPVLYINDNQLTEVNETPSNEEYNELEEEESEEIIIIVSDSHEDMAMQYLQQAYGNQKNIIFDIGTQEEVIIDEAYVQEIDTETSAVEEVCQLEAQENISEINNQQEETVLEPSDTKRLNLPQPVLKNYGRTYECDSNKTTMEHDNNKFYEVIISSHDLKHINEGEESFEVQEKIFVEVTSAESDLSQPVSEEDNVKELEGIVDKESQKVQPVLEVVQEELEPNLPQPQKDLNKFQLQPNPPKIIIQNEIIFEAPKRDKSMFIMSQSQNAVENIEENSVAPTTLEICKSHTSLKTITDNEEIDVRSKENLINITQNSLKDNSWITKIDFNKNQTRSMFDSFKNCSNSQEHSSSTKDKVIQTNRELVSTEMAKPTILETEDVLKKETPRPKMPLKARMKSRKGLNKYFLAEETLNNNNSNIKANAECQTEDVPIKTNLKMPLKAQLKLRKVSTEYLSINTVKIEPKLSSSIKKNPNDELFIFNYLDDKESMIEMNIEDNLSSSINKPLDEKVLTTTENEMLKENTEINLSNDENNEILFVNYDKPMPTRFSQNLDDIFSKLQESGTEMVTEEYLSEDEPVDEKEEEKIVKNQMVSNAKPNKKQKTDIKKKGSSKVNVLGSKQDQCQISTKKILNPNVSDYGCGQKRKFKCNKKRKNVLRPKPNQEKITDVYAKETDCALAILNGTAKAKLIDGHDENCPHLFKDVDPKKSDFKSTDTSIPELLKDLVCSEAPLEKTVNEVTRKNKLKVVKKHPAQTKKKLSSKFQDLKEKIIQNVKQELLAENVTRLRNSKKILRITKKQITEVKEKNTHKRIKIDEKKKKVAIKEKNKDQRIKVREKLLSKQEIKKVKLAFEKLKANKKKQYNDFLRKEKENVVEIKACDIGLPTVPHSLLKYDPDTRRKKLRQKMKDSKNNTDINNAVEVIKPIPPRKQRLQIISNEVINKSKQELGQGKEENFESPTLGNKDKIIRNKIINKSKSSLEQSIKEYADPTTKSKNLNSNSPPGCIVVSNEEMDLTTKPQTASLRKRTYSYRKALHTNRPNLEILKKHENDRISASNEVLSVVNIEVLKTMLKELYKKPPKRLVLNVTGPLNDYDFLKYKDRISKALEKEKQILNIRPKSNIEDVKKLPPNTLKKQEKSIKKPKLNIKDVKEFTLNTSKKQVKQSNTEKTRKKNLKLDVIGVKETGRENEDSAEQEENFNTIIDLETVDELEDSTTESLRQYTRQKLKPNILDVHPWYSIEKLGNPATQVAENLNQKTDEIKHTFSVGQVKNATVYVGNKEKRKVVLTKRMQDFLKTCKKVVVIKSVKQGPPVRHKADNKHMLSKNIRQEILPSVKKDFVPPVLQKADNKQVLSKNISQEIFPPVKKDFVPPVLQKADNKQVLSKNISQEIFPAVEKDFVPPVLQKVVTCIKNNKRRSSKEEIKQETEERYWDTEYNGNLSPLYDDLEEDVPFISRDPAMLQKEDFEDEIHRTPLHSAFEYQEEEAVVTITASDIGGDTTDDEFEETNTYSLDDLTDVKPPQPVENPKITEKKKDIRILSAKIIRRAPIYQDAAKADEEVQEPSDSVYFSRDPIMLLPKKEDKYDPYQFDEESCIGDEIIDLDDVFNELPRVIHDPKKRSCQKNSDRLARPIQVFPCTKCLYIGRNLPNLERHMMMHMDPDDLVWHHCDQCTYKSKYKHALKSHMIVHQDIKRVLSCHLCNYKAFRKAHLNRHVYIAHNINKDAVLYECFDCGKQFRNKPSLTSHVKTVHSTLCEKCQYCNFVTLNQATLASHIKTKHTKPERMYSCEQCQFESKFPRDLDKHVLRMHNRDKMKKFDCTICSFSTIYKNNMRYHMTHVHNSRLDEKVLKQFVCGHCMKVCNNKMALKTHIWQRHMTLTEQSLFKCDKCNFKCKVQQNLKRHVFLKHEHRGTKCEKCDFTTTRTISMVAHMTAHKKEENTLIYRCKDCVYIGYNLSTMTYHMKKFHNKIVSAAELKQYLS